MAKSNGATLSFEEMLWQATQVELEVPDWPLEFLRMRSLDE
jgi:hypothetical protein